MPFIERDPWREQYFKHIECPDSVTISTDDLNSYRLYPKYRWVYDKTNLCKTQGIAHGLWGTRPPRYPVFSKPITNLHGMGIDSHMLHNEADYERYCVPGHFWMEHLTGDHISTDFALLNGEIVWQGHVQGFAADQGTFDYWHISSKPRPALTGYCRQWLRDNITDFTGMVNFESIGGKIIEVHLRLIDQWPDLYGQGWLDAVVGLHAQQKWSYAASIERDAFSVVLFGANGQHYMHPPEELIQDLKNQPHISSVQITFHADAPLEAHAMPPGGFRLAIINCFDLDAGLRARAQLKEFFDLSEGLSFALSVGQASAALPAGM